MSQTVPIEENVKPTSHSGEKPQAQDFDTMTSPQLPSKSGRPSKCLSAAVNSSGVCKKQLQTHGGLNHHPYQSTHPNYTRLDLNTAAKENLSSFTQRVMSAKLLRVKQLQNQLSEAHLQLNELYTENRLLRSLQRRQDLALDRYEGSQAQLPQLVRSHQEEVRVLRTKYKNLKQQYRSVANTLKERESELQNLKEQHAHLMKLSKDRHLGEREALSKQVNELKMTVDNQTSTIQILNRKVLLETKNLKFQLHQEMQKHKATQSELKQTFVKMEQLQMQLDQEKERSILPPSMDRFGKNNTSLKLPLGQKPIRGISLERSPPLNPRFQKTVRESRKQISSNNTDPSSVLLDSSPATYSEKTNDFSTSLDSSPEHTANEINAVAPIIPKASSRQFLRDVTQKGGTDFNINIDSNMSKKATSDDTLEREYENAVAMLTELSNKHNTHFVDDISSSLASLDLTSAKHVAALANATFALKGENQVSIPSQVQQDVSTKINTHEEDNTSNLMKSQQSPVIKDKNHIKTNVMISELPNSQSAKSDNTLKKQNKSMLGNRSDGSQVTSDLIDGLTMKSELGTKKCTTTQDNSWKGSKSTDEEMEVSRKEALLKALKAIDDNSNQANDSDDSDSGILKMPSGPTNTSRMFSSLNSSGIGEGDTSGPNRRRKSFK